MMMMITGRRLFQNSKILSQEIIKPWRRHFQNSKIISREIIKPSSPTPSLLQIYNLSELDQTFNHISTPLVFWYPHDNANCSLTFHDKSVILKQSLSQSLTKYYPFAGRLSAPASNHVDCNDEGVVFVESQYEGHLAGFQDELADDFLSQLSAHSPIGPDAPESRNVLGVQVNHFACGGAAIAVSTSHRIGDSSTLCSFVNHWATIARYGSMDHKQVLPLNPHYIQSATCDNSFMSTLSINQPDKAAWVMKKFVFRNSKLSDLKKKINISHPTRVEVLTCLLYKTAVAAATKKSGYFEPSCLLTMVDIRKRFADRKLPQTTVGNLVSAIMVPMTSPETSLGLLVSEIKKGKLRHEEIPSVQHAAENMVSEMGNYAAMRPYAGSSACGFPFYKADFGWGKPSFVTHHLSKFLHVTGFVITDSPTGDSIEAFVILEKEEMKIFQNDKEMLSFSTSAKFSRL